MEASGISPDKAFRLAAGQIRQESLLLGMNDAFILGSYAFIVLAAFIWLGQPTIARPIERLREAEAKEQLEEG